VSSDKNVTADLQKRRRGGFRENVAFGAFSGERGGESIDGVRVLNR
jgi:hypothetical protein